MITVHDVEWTADHEQYWQGHGLAFSDATHCGIGVGSTLRGAIDDAIEDLAQQDISLSRAQELAIEAKVQADLKSGYDLDSGITVYCEHEQAKDDESEPDCSVCSGEWHYYVSVDVILQD